MKKITPLLILWMALAFPYLKAEEHPSLLKDGTTWCYFSRNYYIPYYEYFRYTLDGDTIINQQTYHKLYEYNTEEYDKKKAIYATAIRKENNKIYCLTSVPGVLPEPNGETIVYDFNLLPGDLFGEKHKNPASDLIVSYVDEIMIDGIPRRRIGFDEYIGVGTVWIEDIGILDSYFFNPTDIMFGEIQIYLDMFLVDGKVIYGAPEFSFVTEGNHWTERNWNENEPPEQFTMNEFKIEGDTLINRKSYKKLYMNEKYKGALRNNIEHKVFYQEEGKPEILLYDFHWEFGKILHATDFKGKDFVIDTLYRSMQEMELEDGKIHKYCEVPYNPNPEGVPFKTSNKKVKLIQHIGLTAGIFKMAEVGKEESSFYTDLVSFYNGKGELIYQNPVFDEKGELLAIHPLETSVKLSVEKNGDQVIFTLSEPALAGKPIIRIYRLDGREISSYFLNDGSVIVNNLAKGMYLYRLDTENKKTETGKFIIK